MAKHTLELFLALITAVAALVLGGAPLFLVKNSRQGDIMLVQDVTLDINISTGCVLWTLTAYSLCTCRNMCWAKPNCRMFSHNAQENQCILSNKGPHECFFMPNPGSATAYVTSTIAYSSYWIGPDGYYYAVSNIAKNFTEAKLTCGKIPGHRLAIFHKMSQYNVLVEIMKDMGGDPQLWMDLMVFPDGPKWGDGTYYSATELQGKVPIYSQGILTPFRTKNGTLDDSDPANPLRFVCQAIP